MHRETKKIQVALFQYLLYCRSLEINPQYLRFACTVLFNRQENALEIVFYNQQENSLSTRGHFSFSQFLANSPCEFALHGIEISKKASFDIKGHYFFFVP